MTFWRHGQTLVPENGYSGNLVVCAIKVRDRKYINGSVERPRQLFWGNDALSNYMRVLRRELLSVIAASHCAQRPVVQSATINPWSERCRACAVAHSR